MLDLNRHYYEETCSPGPNHIPIFETKPGKYDLSGASLGLPTTFRFDESNCDEKRSCACRAKGPTQATGK